MGLGWAVTAVRGGEGRGWVGCGVWQGRWVGADRVGPMKCRRLCRAILGQDAAGRVSKRDEAGRGWDGTGPGGLCARGGVGQVDVW